MAQSGTWRAPPRLSAFEAKRREFGLRINQPRMTRTRRQAAALSPGHSAWGGALRRGCGDRVHHAVMVGHRVIRVSVHSRPRPFREHGAVPCLPVAFESIEHVLTAVLQISSLAWVVHQVEQEFVACDPQVFPVAVANSPVRAWRTRPATVCARRGSRRLEPRCPARSRCGTCSWSPTWSRCRGRSARSYCEVPT